MTMSRHIRLLQEALMDAQPVLDTARHWGRVLAGELSRGGRLLVAGNGGSAAQAQHLTAEIVGRYRDDRAPFSAMPLHGDTSALTAIANDYGLDQLYARQVRAHGRSGDICLLLSTSGHSPNILAAAHAARQAGLRVWAMTGPAPNALVDLADDALSVYSEETCVVQELHLVAVHELCEAFDAALRTGKLAEAAGR
jgi:D-sedoheptulose 7-phosphate isomerase